MFKVTYVNQVSSVKYQQELFIAEASVLVAGDRGTRLAWFELSARVLIHVVLVRIFVNELPWTAANRHETEECSGNAENESEGGKNDFTNNVVRCCFHVIATFNTEWHFGDSITLAETVGDGAFSSRVQPLSHRVPSIKPKAQGVITTMDSIRNMTTILRFFSK